MNVCPFLLSLAFFTQFMWFDLFFYNVSFFIKIFFLTLNDNQPKYILGDSLIGLNPGLGIRPREVKNFFDT